MDSHAQSQLIDQARTALRHREPSLGLAICHQLLEADPDSIEALTLRSKAHQQLGLHELALDDVLRAVRLRPEDARLRTRLVVALWNAKQRDAALLVYRGIAGEEEMGAGSAES